MHSPTTGFLKSFIWYVISGTKSRTVLQKSPYYALIMLRAVPLCPKHASTILQLNAQLENLITLMNVLLECFI